jgi:exopolysaccharide biosynthesis polyprenyl glycosylphosphotransferase
MFAYRLRGLVTLHSFVVSGFITALLPLYSEAIYYLPGFSLSHDVRLLPYCIAVFLAMTASSDVIRRASGNLHAISFSRAIALAIQQTSYVAASVFASVFVLKDQTISRLFLGTYLLLSLILLALLHHNLPSSLAKLLFPERNILPTLLIGSGTSIEELDTWISARGHIGIKPIGFISDKPLTRGERVLAPYLGNFDQLETVLTKLAVAQVILLDWHQKDEAIERIVDICEKEGVRFLIHNNYAARFAREMIPVEEGGRHFLVMQTEPLEDPINRTVKRILDVVISLPVCLFVLPPLCLLVFTMQRIQAPGRLFFNRPRGGLNRKLFIMFKFRSMYSRDHDTNKQATMGDSRVFPFGAIMRQTSIDEFPQFYNVLRGDMSIVGPRPHLPQHDDEFSRMTPTYHCRARVKPGITGLAQVRGYRGEITEPHKLHRRVYWDLYYGTRWSIWLDIRIILTTAWHVFSPPESAY